ncbi:hypothetical protein IEQ34_013481 [Dendrobium chrysotoxum]|uniref:Uncharacterized protein n=1 Tax=Dendrobium chrysotoxum TaxID=161865 RepID=A0AAV7GPV2_DENCH|nr:hypothetical protein IEQ34_013481 [Dendrobium chrysotoxum]
MQQAIISTSKVLFGPHINFIILHVRFPGNQDLCLFRSHSSDRSPLNSGHFDSVNSFRARIIFNSRAIEHKNCVSELSQAELLAMNFEHVFQMLGGGGQTSYAKNSKLQEKAVIKIKPLVEESIKQICKTLPEKLVAADLGCSSGPNTLLVLTQILNAVYEYCTQSSQQMPEIQYFLNDLPNNDFNNIFQLSVQYQKKIREEKGDDYVPFYVVGLPGSFYKRLFPSKSVNIFYSSYSVHWLSQVPKGLEEEGYHLNEKEIYINKGSSSIVAQLYLKQFKRDFSDFLKSRSKELIFGGRIILSILGRTDWQSIGGLLYTWGLIAEALKAMVLEVCMFFFFFHFFSKFFFKYLKKKLYSFIYNL